MPRFGDRSYPLLVAVLMSVGPAAGQDAIRLIDRFDPADSYRVDLRGSVSGKLTVPTEPGKPPKVVAMAGTSLTSYDERPLPPDDTRTDRVVRIYRDVQFRRTVGDREQEAGIRPAVRRMVVLRSDHGKKAPFSPDGPLQWGEIDVVRTDLFVPALVHGLLPPNPVRPGDRWPLSPAAVTDLTDLDPVDEGSLSGQFAGVVTLDGRRYAKLTIAGTVKGVTEDGPARQKLDGLAYYDLTANRVTYLSLAGGRELLGPDGKTVVGRTDGKLTLTRRMSGPVAELSDAALRDADPRPTPENTLLLYDNPDLGVRFLHPRRWRVVTVRGQQVILEEGRGGSILISVEPAARVPTAAQFRAETEAYLKGEKWAVTGSDPPARWAAGLDRFGLDAEVNKERVRMEYAVLAGPDGGATVAARLPWADRDDLRPDVDRVLRTLAVTKAIKK